MKNPLKALTSAILGLGMPEGHIRGEFCQVAGEALDFSSVVRVLGRGPDNKSVSVQWYQDTEYGIKPLPKSEHPWVISTDQITHITREQAASVGIGGRKEARP